MHVVWIAYLTLHMLWCKGSPRGAASPGNKRAVASDVPTAAPLLPPPQSTKPTASESGSRVHKRPLAGGGPSRHHPQAGDDQVTGDIEFYCLMAKR